MVHRGTVSSGAFLWGSSTGRTPGQPGGGGSSPPPTAIHRLAAIQQYPSDGTRINPSTQFLASMRDTVSSGSSVARQPVSLPALLCLTVCLLGAWTASPTGTRAQARVEQVEKRATPEVEGASQSEVVVAQDASNTQDEDAKALISDEAPVVTANGNSASIFQDGNNNEAQVRQRGSDNKAQIRQIGNGNDAQIRQVGTSNEAFASQPGSDSEIAITQGGSGNVANIRLSGSGSAVTLLQKGSKNRFLVNTSAEGIDMNIVQNGSGNSLETNVPVNAEMNGNGIEMVIRRRAGGGLLPLGTGE